MRRFTAPLAFAILSPLLIAAEAVLALARWRNIRPFIARGKVVVITGASSGIGTALAFAYARQGAKIVLCARRRNELEKVASQCLQLGAQEAVPEVVDVANEAEVKSAIVRTGNRFGCIDLIILNAGISMGDFASNFTDISAFERIMAVNYYGLVSGVVHAIPFLKKAERGKIVAISSVLGIVAAPLRSGYCASKFAMKGFLDSVRMENPDLDFTMIYPGAVRTNINDSRLGALGNLDMNAKGVMPADEAARLIVAAVNRCAREERMLFKQDLISYICNLFPLVRDKIVGTTVKTAFTSKNE
ncbi:hypothetical protein HDU83_009559 [Entophlyctis luteolus]|nr:hypothetical protein HDU83_009559 [Entophlyctis luteolus]